MGFVTLKPIFVLPKVLGALSHMSVCLFVGLCVCLFEALYGKSEGLGWIKF
jgi:hypothetical protein